MALNTFESFGNPYEISGNPGIPDKSVWKFLGISEVPQISYAILGSEIRAVESQLGPWSDLRGKALERLAAGAKNIFGPFHHFYPI